MFVQTGSVAGLPPATPRHVEFGDVESLVEGALRSLRDRKLEPDADEAYAQCQVAYDWRSPAPSCRLAIGKSPAQKRLH